MFLSHGNRACHGCRSPFIVVKLYICFVYHSMTLLNCGRYIRVEMIKWDSYGTICRFSWILFKGFNFINDFLSYINIFSFWCRDLFFKILFQHLTGGTEKNILSAHDTLLPGLEPKPGSPGYEP